MKSGPAWLTVWRVAAHGVAGACRSNTPPARGLVSSSGESPSPLAGRSDGASSSRRSHNGAQPSECQRGRVLRSPDALTSSYGAAELASVALWSAITGISCCVMSRLTQTTRVPHMIASTGYGVVRNDRPSVLRTWVPGNTYHQRSPVGLLWVIPTRPVQPALSHVRCRTTHVAEGLVVS